jgi:carbon storage regulator
VLVFTRKRNEAIMIGDGIEVRVLRVGRDGVRIGVTAPAAVAVHRREIYDQICEENRSAAGTAAAAHLLVERLRKIAAQVQPTAPAAPAVQPGTARS